MSVDSSSGAAAGISVSKQKVPTSVKVSFAVLVSQHQSVIAQALHNTVRDFPEKEYTKVDSSKQCQKRCDRLVCI